MKKELVFKKERIEIRSHLASSYDRLIKNDVSHGLGLEKKSLPSKYFYDSRGSRLFEKICALPEYYPTRTEMSILREAAPQIMEDFTSGDIVELGSGANWKVRMLLDAAGQERLKDLRYVPVDVSESALQDASEELLRIYPELEVLGIIADFTVHMDLIPSERPRLMVFLGSTIGNFDERARRDFLKGAAAAMKPEDRFLIGFDMVKSRDTLEAAYNDEQGVTSEFNKNVLHVLNRELNADFNISHFDHLAFFNEEKQRVEMHLRAKRDMEVSIEGLDMQVEFRQDETIHTEVCRKFTESDVRKLVGGAGLEIERWFFDKKSWFSLVELKL